MQVNHKICLKKCLDIQQKHSNRTYSYIQQNSLIEHTIIDTKLTHLQILSLTAPSNTQHEVSQYD